MRWLLALLLLFSALIDGPSVVEVAGYAAACGAPTEHVVVEGQADSVDDGHHAAIHLHAGQGHCGHVHAADQVALAVVTAPLAYTLVRARVPASLDPAGRAISPPNRPPVA
ncbi:MAG: hypothetical protein PW843_26515 [Azospirillaceae bacterium]|nr:hypothetical protein [Azospirillaceae bacterium]